MKSSNGLLFHVSIVTGCFFIFAAPYLHYPNVCLFIVFVGITHFIQDWAKIKFTTQSKHHLIWFLIDQTLHIAFIAILFFTNLKNITPPLSPRSHVFMNMYSNNPVMLYFIASLIASYGGHYIIVLFKQDYLHMKSSDSLFEKLQGFMERILIVSTFFIGMPQPVLIPLIFIIRPYLYIVSKDTLNLSSQFSSFRELLFSGALGIAVGLILYMLL